MPSSDEETRALMRDWFGEIDDGGPVRVLHQRGYRLTRQWGWVKPTRSHTVHQIEWTLIRFLIEEWDYDGIQET